MRSSGSRHGVKVEPLRGSREFLALPIDDAARAFRPRVCCAGAPAKRREAASSTPRAADPLRCAPCGSPRPVPWRSPCSVPPVPTSTRWTDITAPSDGRRVGRDARRMRWMPPMPHWADSTFSSGAMRPAGAAFACLEVNRQAGGCYRPEETDLRPDCRSFPRVQYIPAPPTRPPKSHPPPGGNGTWTDQ